MPPRYIHEGRVIDFLPEADTAAGTVIVLGSLVGITKTDITAGTTGAVHVVGVYDIEKANVAVPPGNKDYLDAAKDYQSAILFLNFKGNELADEIIQCCAAGLVIAIGNSTAVSGCTEDRNGIKVATLRGSWAHATHFTAYRVVNGTEYIGWVNSHGSRYKSSDEGEPADMCWMSRDIVERFVATATGYGSPYVVFPESVRKADTSLYVQTQISFPTIWRT